MSNNSDFHDKPFDEGTQIKLTLFKHYLKDWLPVFLSRSKPTNKINIVDLFAGPGVDSNGRSGRPLIALKVVREYTSLIARNKITVRIILNDRTRRAANSLEKEFIRQNIPASLCSWSVDCMDVKDALIKYLPDLSTGPSMLFLDQFGIIRISEEFFKIIISLPRTDFLFFVSSSHLRRFAEHPNIKNCLSISKETFNSSDFENTPRAVVGYL